MTTLEMALEEEFEWVNLKRAPLPLPTGHRLRRDGPFQPPVPTTNVIGEIKPHTAGGIGDGIRQLRGRRTKGPPAGRTKKLILITYRPSGRQLEVLIADPKEVEKAINNPGRPYRADGWQWYTLGKINFDINQKISASDCEIYVGKQAEPLIRELYKKVIRPSPITWVRKDNASVKGPDIEHEFAALLAEFELSDSTLVDRILEQLRKELELRFTRPKDPRLVQRYHRLRVLFASFPQSQSRALYGRLGERPTSDRLSQLFHGRLATATRRELLRILRTRFPAPQSGPGPAQGPAALPPLTWPKRPLPADARDRYSVAAAAFRRKVVGSGDPRARRFLCILDKLATGADDRVIEWHRICPSTTGAIGAAWVIGACDLTQGPSVDQAALESAIRSVGDVEPANRRLEFITHARSQILFAHDISSESLHLESLRRTHDDVQRALANLDRWANSPMGGSSAMPPTYRGIAGWIQRQRNSPTSVLSCF